MSGGARDWERDELAAWLRLIATPGVGRESARRLLAAFGSPEAVLTATAADRKQFVGPAAAQALAVESEGFAALLARTCAWLADGEQHALVALGDPAYPELLLQTADPPLLLHAAGRLELLRAPSLAIVGSVRCV